MQFAFVLSFFMMFTAILALPSGHVFMRASCNIAKCVAALAPTAVSCTGAAAQEGANVLADAACLASAINAGENTPAACQPCIKELGLANKVKTVEKDTKKVASKVGSEVSSVAHKVGSVLGSIF